MNPGRVLAFLKRSDKGTYYATFGSFGMFPVNGNTVSWPEDNQFAEIKPTLLSDVFNDINNTRVKLEIARKN